MRNASFVFEKMALIALVSIFIVAVLSSRAFALVEVQARSWLFTDLDSTIKVSQGTVIGTEIDPVDDLGFDNHQTFFEGRLQLGLGGHKLRYAFMPLKWDGEEVISKSIVFNGKTYTASTVVDSELSVNYHRLGYEYDIIDTLDNKIGVIIEAKYFDVDAKVKSALFDESESADAVFPAVGVAANLSLPFLFSFGGEVTGMSLGSSYGYIVDGEAAVHFKPVPFVGISGGYRYLGVSVEHEFDKGEVLLHGPFVMLRARF